jgi:hypothetical protein
MRNSIIKGPLLLIRLSTKSGEGLIADELTI